MGIRPEALYTDESRPANKCLGKFKAEVELTELMGAETYLYLTVNKNSIIARVNLTQQLNLVTLWMFTLMCLKFTFLIKIPAKP